MRRIFAIAVMGMALSAVLEVRAQDVKLPAPDKELNTKSVMDALASRHSVREFGSRELSEQELSNLCWAACGQTRDEQHITAPSAMNRQEIRLFVLTQRAAYEYDALQNVLRWKAEGDHRGLLATNDVAAQGFRQEFVMQAPVSLVMVIDFEKFGSHNEKALMMGCVDAGNVSENVNLYCEAAGLCTVPRATMDVKALREVLGLGEEQLPVMNNPVGYPVAGDPLPHVYDESIDPMEQIDNAVAKAQKEGRRVICQVGGNWCIWCLRFADFVKKDAKIAEVIAQNYEYIHVNRPRQSQQREQLLRRLGNPDRFGYPALVVLNSDGSVEHIQDSALLESGQGYDRKKVLRFLVSMAPRIN